MASGSPATALAPDPPSPAEAERALESLVEISSVRGATLLDAAGEPLAATGARAAWADAARRLIAAADLAEDRPAARVHVATEDGEVFAIRDRDLILVAATGRLPLASLTFSDMRAALRELRATAGGRSG